MYRFVIFQIPIENSRERLFQSFEDNSQLNMSVYRKVYTGTINRKELKNEMEALNTLFYIFNMRHPDDYKGRSLSIGDIVMIDDKMYYCQPVGWKEIERKN